MPGQITADWERVRGRIERLRGVINLRWMAVVGVAVSDLLTQLAGYTGSGRASAELLVSWAIAPVVLGYNVVFLAWLRRTEQSQAPLDQVERSLRWQLPLQALCDIVTMTILVYINGGIEYPLFYIPLLAVIVTGMFLPSTFVFLQANVGAVLFAAMALAECQGWIPHLFFLSPEYRHDLYRDPRAALGIALSMAGMLNVMALMVSNIGRRLRRAEARPRELLRQLRGQVGEAAGRLAQSTTSLERGAGQMSQAAEQVASTVQQIAQGAGQQAAQLEKLSRNLEDLAEAGRRVAEGAQETHQAAGKAAASAGEGRQAARQATDRMEEIARVFAQTQEAMAGLARRSDEIAEIAAAIDRFAERTDLLALNAGIEAARAGEHGRGFAVVAGEVKKLAASSSASAERVAEMVTQVQAEIAGVMRSIQAGAERVSDGQEAIVTLSQVLDGMAAVISRTDELAGLMEHLAWQQREAHGEITHAAEEIAGAAEQTAAGAEQMAAAVEQQTTSFSEFSQSVQDIAGLAAHLDRAVTDLTEAHAAKEPGGAPGHE